MTSSVDSIRVDSILSRSGSLQLGMEFAVRVYMLTQKSPREELYGLTSQLRRAAVAIPSSLSEGHQQSSKVYLHCVGMALGSLAEADTQLEIASRLQISERPDVDSVVQRAARLSPRSAWTPPLACAANAMT